jgi:hypothetical protein
VIFESVPLQLLMFFVAFACIAVAPAASEHAHYLLYGPRDKPLPYHQPDPISRARFRSALVGKRGASLPPHAFWRRRGMTRARPLV